MSSTGVPVVLFPRFSTLVGVGDFRGLPIEVSPYASMNLSVWRGQLAGTGTVVMAIEESLDRADWTACASNPVTPSTPPPMVETAYTVEFSKPWMRMRVALTGTSPGITFWAAGILIRRKE